MPKGTSRAEATLNSEKIKPVALAVIKLRFYLTNTASLSSGKIEAGFWVMLFRGPRLLLCGPYYTVLSYCMICNELLLKSNCPNTDFSKVTGYSNLHY